MADSKRYASYFARLARLAQRLLEAGVEDELETLGKDTPLVFYCHTGMRSQNAADQFVRDGWKRVYNLEGGIDAWSREVDPTVPRY